MSAQQKTSRPVRSGDLKSLRDFVEDNLLCAGRKSYYQRIIIVSKHKLNSNMRNIYTTVYTETNKNVLEDKMTGLFLIYRHFGVILVEGSEAVLGKFITKLTAVQEECLEASIIVAIYNNANQRMFNKIISRMGEPSTRIELPNPKDSTDTLDIVSRFLRTIYALCKRINSDDLDDNAFLYLPTSYNKFLPAMALLESLFACPELMQLSAYTQQVFDVVPETSLYSELVWPAPRHYSFQSQGFDRQCADNGKQTKISRENR